MKRGTDESVPQKNIAEKDLSKDYLPSDSNSTLALVFPNSVSSVSYEYAIHLRAFLAHLGYLMNSRRMPTD